MLAGLPAAIALLAEEAVTPVPNAAAPPAVAGPPAPPPPRPVAKTAETACPPPTQDPSARVIVVCAQRPNGYRIDPDVLAARKAKKEALAGRPKPPSKMPDTSCTVVGPAGCILNPQPMIDIVSAVATAATMLNRAVTGGNVGQMFVTDPQPSEYELYKQAKARREAEEAEKAARAKAKAAKATSDGN